MKKASKKKLTVQLDLTDKEVALLSELLLKAPRWESYPEAEAIYDALENLRPHVQTGMHWDENRRYFVKRDE